MARTGFAAGSPFARRAQSAGGLTALAGVVVILIALAFAAALGAAASDQGLLEIRVKDHREAIEDFSRLTLTLGNIAISPKAGLAIWTKRWRELPTSVRTIDLTKYLGNSSVAVFKGSMDAGAFDAVQLKLDGIEGVLKKNQRQANVKNTLTPIKLPFSVERNGETIIVLDLVVLDMSDHPPRGYELGLRGYALYKNGKLIDKVPPG
jgi:hypothetical protein